MFGSTILDVALGLVFIFLLYSLLATTIHEGIASVLGLRAKTLEQGINRMLNDGNSNNFAQNFFNHPLIKYMGNGKYLGGLINKGPSYISAQNFSLALTDIMRTGQAAGDAATQIGTFLTSEKAKLIAANPNLKPTDIRIETLNTLNVFWTEANGDFVKFRNGLEQWYDDTMDRVSGWYKRQTQLTMLIIGLAIATSFNVDTIQIAKKLSVDKDARSQLVNMAIQYSKTHAKDSAKMINKMDTLTYQDLNATKSILGLGYGKDTILLHKIRATGGNVSAYEETVPSMIGGWLILAFAVSLGAPFWFDMLQKIINLRGTGPSPDETSSSNSSQAQSPPVKTVG
jgi:hypothetical protein